MDSTFFTILSVMSLVAILYVVTTRVHLLKRSYNQGLTLWGRWLPVASTGLYLAVLSVNLAPGGPMRGHSLSLDGVFSTTEIIVLFLVGPLYLTRLGNILATATIAYCIERLLADSSTTPHVGLFLVTGAATVVAVLGDKMPWLAGEGPQILAIKLRQILLTSITIAALAVIAVGVIKVHSFSRWITTVFGWQLPDIVVLGILLALFFGWMSVALGFTRHVTIPALCVPTLLVLAFVTEWPSTLLIIPFALCLALSLATGDRRIQGRRRATNFNTSVVFFR